MQTRDEGTDSPSVPNQGMRDRVTDLMAVYYMVSCRSPWITETNGGLGRIFVFRDIQIETSTMKNREIRSTLLRRRYITPSPTTPPSREKRKKKVDTLHSCGRASFLRSGALLEQFSIIFQYFGPCAKTFLGCRYGG